MCIHHIDPMRPASKEYFICHKSQQWIDIQLQIKLGICLFVM